MEFRKKIGFSSIHYEGTSDRAYKAERDGMVRECDLFSLTGFSAAFCRKIYRPREWHHVWKSGRVVNMYYYYLTVLANKICETFSEDPAGYSKLNKKQKDFLNDQDAAVDAEVEEMTRKCELYTRYRDRRAAATA